MPTGRPSVRFRIGRKESVVAYGDIAARRRNDRERFHRGIAARRAAGLCLRCGKTEPEPERTLCAPCAEKRCADDRARTSRLRPEDRPRRDPERAKRYERKRRRRRHAERKAAGLWVKCGRAPAFRASRKSFAGIRPNLT